jgi:hypothetical protein
MTFLVAIKQWQKLKTPRQKLFLTTLGYSDNNINLVYLIQKTIEQCLAKYANYPLDVILVYTSYKETKLSWNNFILVHEKPLEQVTSFYNSTPLIPII